MGKINHKIGFVGAGNMTRAIISGLLNAQLLSPQDIFVTNRSPRKLENLKNDFNIQTLSSNDELLEKSDVIVLATKPQDMRAALEPLGSSFIDSQVVMSLAAGISLKALQKMAPSAKRWVRVMPNTPISLGRGVIGYSLTKADDLALESLVESLFATMGQVFKVDEGEELEALTISASSGVGFIFELMIYWQEWLEEHGFSGEEARNLTVQTFLGASLLAEEKGNLPLQELQNKVVSKKGVTAAGLDSMRELEVERALRYSFEKAVLRDRELGVNS